MPAVETIPTPGDVFVDAAIEARKTAQPRVLVDWDQGPSPVVDTRQYPDPSFNPQVIEPVGDGRDEYPANPVILWYNWTVRDPSQSIKVQNNGATNITPRAPLDQQRGRQQPKILSPNQSTQSPTDWDDQVQVTAGPSAEAQRVALASKFANYSPAVVA